MYKAIFFLLLLLVKVEGDKKSFFTSPLDIPLTLSANFGELRPGHFHSGVDFKTLGVNGKKVMAVADGYIYRISVSPGGFGNAVYIRHSNGYSTVYGHLDRFIPEIEDYVTDYQYRKESFSVNIMPESKSFPVKQGQLIGYSGNTGSSFGPHLHFEVRKSRNEHPIDPLQFFNMPDDIKPVIKQFTIYPLGKGSLVEGRTEKSNFPLTGSKGTYRPKSNSVIKVSGEFGVGLTAWDFLNNSWNKCGIRSLEVRVDSNIIYRHFLDEFSFSNTRYLNSHIDYDEYLSSRTYIQKAFIQANNNLCIYDTILNRGRIKLTDNKLHSIEMTAKDYAGNQSHVLFTVQNTPSFNPASEKNKAIARLMPFNERNEFLRHDIKLIFPENSFYDTLAFDYMKTPGDSTLLADIHYIHSSSVPVHKYFNISIKPTINDSSLLAKACIVSLQNDKPGFIGGEYNEGFIDARIRDFGVYSISLDTLAPVIEPVNIPADGHLSGRNELRIRVKDEFSGIAKYEAYIDGKWALFEWDPKNDLMKFVFRKARISANESHNLKLIVEDACGNTSSYETSFFR